MYSSTELKEGDKTCIAGTHILTKDVYSLIKTKKSTKQTTKTVFMSCWDDRLPFWV